MSLTNRLAMMTISGADNKTKSTEYIYKDNIDNGINYFKNWASNTSYSTFQISSVLKFHHVKFSIYNRVCSNGNECIIICKVVFNKVVSENSYKITSNITQLDIDNIGDIISLMAKISRGDIVYFKDKSMVDLINMQLERIATKID